MPSSDHHHSPPTQNSLYFNIDESQAKTNSTSHYRNSSTRTISSVIDSDLTSDPNNTSTDIRATLDLPSSLLRNPSDHQTRLPENNFTSADLSHDLHLPHSSPHCLQGHHPTLAGGIPNQNITSHPTPGNIPADAHKQTPSAQSTGAHLPNQLESLSSKQPQCVPPGNPNPPLKKNGKPLAQCPFCGMTFKKLEHCQRHERTHTLARPYPCAVCSKTFARQDTLNRHLRLHSRSEGRVTINKSTSQGQESQPRTASSGSFKSPPPARERGLSLSALEHSSFPRHTTRDAPVIGSDIRQSISLPVHRSQQHHLTPSFQFNPSCSQGSPMASHIPSQPPGTSTLCFDGSPSVLTEVRRGSWCPGVQTLSDMTIFSTGDTSNPQPMRNHSTHGLQLNLGVDSWEANLTTTFGLVDAGIGPVPQSAPATCTQWSAVGMDSMSSNVATSSSLVPTWESHPQFDSHSQSKPPWSALGRLEEEDHAKTEPERRSSHGCQLILSSPSQPESFDQLNSMDPNCLLGSSAAISSATVPTADTSSFWSLSLGPNLPGQSSYDPNSSHPVSTSQQDAMNCFGNHWSTPQKSSVEIFNPVIWHPPTCHNGEDIETKALGDSGFSGPNPMTMNNSWENNWEEIVELGF